MTRCFYGVKFNFPWNFWTDTKIISGIKFCPQHLLPVPPSWRNKVCKVVIVRSCSCFLSSCITLGIFVITQPGANLFNSLKIVFDSLNFHLYSRNHCEERCKKFITRSKVTCNNKSPSINSSDFSFDTCRQSGTVLKSQREHIFSFGKTFSFERKLF